LRSLAPQWLKSFYRRALAVLDPYPGRIDRGVYRETAALLRRTSSYDARQMAAFQSEQLRDLILHCARSVPFYRDLFGGKGIEPRDIRSPADLAVLPMIDREHVRSHLPEFLSEDYPARRRRHESTGGTSGRPLVFYSEKGFSAEREWAFWHALAARAGYRTSDRLAVLRNDALPGGRLFIYNPATLRLVMDPFKLNPGSAGQYLGAMRRYGTRFLHTYPSAATVLLRFASESGIRADGILDALLCGSENVYEGQRAALEEGFGARFFSWYGHSEKLVLAGECEYSTDYHSFPEYGVLELVDGDGRPVTAPGIPGEIVGTGFNNRVMPLLRYRTGDFAEWTEDVPCRCGRPHPRIRGVRGRWLQEMVMGRSGSCISMTSINMHSDVFDRVLRFQFVQEEKGRLILNIVRGGEYTDRDTDAVRREILRKIGSEVELEVRFVEDIPTTGRGKQRFLVQNLELPGSR